MTVPRATELAAMVRLTLLTSAEPSMLNEPVTSPPAKVTVREFVHFPAEVAVSALPTRAPRKFAAWMSPSEPEKTSEVLVASGMKVK